MIDIFHLILRFILLSFVNATIVLTITKSELFAPFRYKMEEIHIKLGQLFSCHYCLSHWSAFLLIALTGVNYNFTKVFILDFLFNSFALVSMSTIIVHYIFYSYKPKLN